MALRLEWTFVVIHRTLDSGSPGWSIKPNVLDPDGADSNPSEVNLPIGDSIVVTPCIVCDFSDRLP